jgi:hypothetical protein
MADDNVTCTSTTSITIREEHGSGVGLRTKETSVTHKDEGYESDETSATHKDEGYDSDDTVELPEEELEPIAERVINEWLQSKRKPPLDLAKQSQSARRTPTLPFYQPAKVAKRGKSWRLHSTCKDLAFTQRYRFSRSVLWKNSLLDAGAEIPYYKGKIIFPYHKCQSWCEMWWPERPHVRWSMETIG